MPAMVVERQKITQPMWDSLKRHILRERQRKKQEQEADAEVERQRREREDQQKEQEMTLEETKEQIAQLESRLAQLKDDKHQLFLQLKKVLNEDETRRRIKESTASDLLFYGYPPGAGLSIHPGHPQLYIPGIPPVSRSVYKGIKEEPLGSLPGAPPPGVYGPPMSVLTISPSTGQGQLASNQKRSRSPSPPPQAYHSYKNAAAPSPYSSKSINSSPYGTAPPGAVFYGHNTAVSSAPSHSTASTIGFHPPGSLPQAVYSYPPIQSSSHSSRPPYSAQVLSATKEEAQQQSKQHPSIYLSHPAAPIASRAYGGSVPVEHLIGKPSIDQEKYYQSLPTRSSPQPATLRPVTILSSSSLHSSGIPVQQSPQSKSGSITSGHPVRAPQPSSSYHSTSSSGHGQPPRVVYSQPGSNGSQLPSRYYGNPNQRDN